MTNATKPEVVKMFLRGTDLKDVAIFFGCSQGTVQTVLREALTGLSELNSELARRAGLRARAAEDVAAPAPLVELV